MSTMPAFSAPPLTLSGVLPVLIQRVEKQLDRQVLDATHPDYGGVVEPEWGLADRCAMTAGATLLTGLMTFGVARKLDALENLPPDLLDRLTLLMDQLLRRQRSSGRVDLITCNFDSGPDTGFLVQQLGCAYHVAREWSAADDRLPELLQRIETLLRRAAPGLITGGIHTPNHRWAVTSALALIHQLFPEVPVESGIAPLLAEGIDTDAEGFHSERSIGVYDSLNDRAFLIWTECGGPADLLDHVRNNLELNLHLFHADGSAETGLSSRQDKGQKVVPAGFASCYLWMAALEGDGRFAAMAQQLWHAALAGPSQPALASVGWLAHALLRFGDRLPAPAPLPREFDRTYPRAGLHRIGRGAWDVSIFRGRTSVLNLQHGPARLASLSISQPYMGIGQFQASAMHVQPQGTIELVSAGRRYHDRPGYVMPLGEPVVWDDDGWWGRAQQRREVLRQPDPEMVLTITPGDEGLSCRLRTVSGLDGVAVQIALDFPPGGLWVTESDALAPVAGQTVLLRQGAGRMVYGTHFIEVACGSEKHRMWMMRDAPVAEPGLVRVLIALQTPVDHEFTLRVGRDAGLARG